MQSCSEGGGRYIKGWASWNAECGRQRSGRFQEESSRPNTQAAASEAGPGEGGRCIRSGALMSPACPLLLADSKAIVDGNLKLILGLIWTLILHYSISMPMWEDEDDEDARKQTPKQRLLGWIQNKVPQLPITNFNRDWQDGKALGALVDNCAPGEWTHGTPWLPEPGRGAG